MGLLQRLFCRDESEVVVQGFGCNTFHDIGVSEARVVIAPSNFSTSPGYINDIQKRRRILLEREAATRFKTSTPVALLIESISVVSLNKH
jgi:hypothetical protein